MAEEEETQVRPLAPARIYGRSDEEIATVKPRRQQRSSKFLVYILTLIVLLSIALLAFALTVFRIKPPEVKLSSATIQHLTYIASSPSASLNATIVAELSVKNKNFGRFEFGKFNAVVLYGGVTIGGAKIGGGSAGARETERLNVTVRVRSVGVLKESESRNFNRDVNSGLVKLRSYAKISGWVRVMKIVHMHRSSEMNCTMTLNLTTKTIHDLRCL